jgi:hypothetical protein
MHGVQRLQHPVLEVQERLIHSYIVAEVHILRCGIVGNPKVVLKSLG